MPPTSSQMIHSHRASFYGRSRTQSSDSTESHRSSSNNNSSNSRQRSSQQSVASSASSSVPSSSTSKSDISVSSSSSPHYKHNNNVAVATLAAANPTSKQLHSSSSAAVTKSSSNSSIHIHIEGLKEKSTGRSTLLDEPSYQLEAIAHMHHMEGETVACVDLMDAQPELRWFMRPYLVDFIVEIHQTFRLRPETLYLTMNIVDRYVSKRIVYKRHFQLVGCAALLIAAKFEDSKDKVPTVSELSQMCCSAYDESAFTQMEGHVLSTIGWVLGFPTPESWLRITSLQSNLDLKTQSIARFFMEATLFHRDFVGLLPSQLAAGALMLAKFVCGKAKSPSAEDTEETIAAAQSIDTYMIEHSSELSEILIKKYNYNHFAFASKLVKEWYARSNQAQKNTAATGLLPAQSVLSAQILASHDKVAITANASTAAMTSSSPNGGNISFSSPHRSDQEGDISMESRCTTPSSMISSPSRMSGAEDEDEVDDEEGEDEDEEEDDEVEEEEDHDMPVTPLSLNGNHDPLLATSHSSSQCGSNSQKESTTRLLHPSNSKSQSNFLQVTAPRPTLCLNQQGNTLNLA